MYKIESSELRIIWPALHNELAQLGVQIKQDDNKSELKRNYFRTFFSMVEAIGYSTRQILLNKHLQNQIELSVEEVHVLKEKTIDLDPNGKIKIKDSYFNFEAFFRFTYRTYSKYQNKVALYEELISDMGYRNFKDSIKIRNRITHPKGSESILVSNAEYDNICKAHDWYHNFIFKIFEGDVFKVGTF